MPSTHSGVGSEEEEEERRWEDVWGSERIPGSGLQEPLLLRQGLSYPKRLWDLPSPALGLQVFATAPGFLKCGFFRNQAQVFILAWEGTI